MDCSYTLKRDSLFSQRKYIWNTKSLLLFVAIIQIALLESILLSFLGIDFPILRQVMGFIYLTFLPGVLIIHILNIKNIGTTRYFLYTVGLSISFIMFVGLLCNLILPIFGINNPISIIPLFSVFTGFIISLCFIAYKYRKCESRTLDLGTGNMTIPAIIFILILPFLALLGIQYINIYSNNKPLICFIALIPLTGLIFLIKKSSLYKLYPLAIFSFCLFILWSISFITNQLTGHDEFAEYYFANSSINNGFWDYKIAHDYNATLSVNLLMPIYSLMMKLDLVWIIKGFYPLFFCLTPVALYELYRKRFNVTTSFLAVFFFISIGIFIYLADIPKLLIAEPFMALCFLLLLDRKLSEFNKRLLLIIFGISIVLSHYTTAVLFIALLIISFIVIKLLSFIEKHRKPISDKNHIIVRNINPIRPSYILLIVITWIGWYMIIASGFTFNKVIVMGQQLIQRLTTDFFNPIARSGSVINVIAFPTDFFNTAAAMQTLYWYLNLCTQICLVIGAIWLFIHFYKKGTIKLFIILCLSSVILMVLSIVLPYLSSFVYLERFYHVSLFFLAPIFVLISISILKWLYKKVFKSPQIALYVFFLLILVPYFLFSTGFLYGIINNTSSSRVLYPQGNDYPIFNDTESNSVKWLINNVVEHDKITGNNKSRYYGDYYGYLYLYSFLGPQETDAIPLDIKQSVRTDSYIFLRRWNVTQGGFFFTNLEGAQQINREIYISEKYEDQFERAIIDRLYGRSKIYCTRETEIYR